MKNYLLFLLVPLISSCSFNESYYISSPVGNNKIKFEWKNTLNPNDEGHVKLSLPEMDKSYLNIRQVMDFSIHIYWGDTIKVRGGKLIGADTSSGMLNWRANYNKEEELQVGSDTIKW